MLKIFAGLCLSLLLVSTCHAGSESLDIDGIWQDTRNANSYYSIHVRGDTLLFIDLTHIERTGSKLKASYTGKVGDGVLTQLAPEYPSTGHHLQVFFQLLSPTRAVFAPICDVCGVVLVELHKVF